MSDQQPIRNLQRPEQISTDQEADSRVLLRTVLALVHERDYKIGNVDTVVVCERPKLAPHVDAMRRHLADDLRSDIGAVSVQATTSEKLGFTGRGEGIAAQAAATLVPLGRT